MQSLLTLARWIDTLNRTIGRFAVWTVLVVVLISAGNAASRFFFNQSSNAMLEIQWYLFSALFLLCGPYVLLKNEHIRIDIIVGRFSQKTQNTIDVVGLLLFLLPMAAMITYYGWGSFITAWDIREVSSNPGGLVRWPVRLLLPVGGGLLFIQGVAELIKRLAFLTGTGPDCLAKAAGPTIEEELAEEIRSRSLAPKAEA